jgi:hypothetical protein
LLARRLIRFAPASPNQSCEHRAKFQRVLPSGYSAYGLQRVRMPIRGGWWLVGDAIVKALLIGSVTALALAVHSAFAADLPLPARSMAAPPPPPAMNWTGCYAAAGGGYGMWNQDSYSETFPAPLTPLTGNSTSGGRG